MEISLMKKETKTNPLLEFIDRSPTPFHAVQEMTDYLSGKGFNELNEADSWDLVPNGKYFLTRNGSSLIAFTVGSKPEFKIIGAHTDSPNLRLKPNAGYTKSGYQQLGVEVYGGVLLSTWTDRDLSLAGRVILAGKKKPSSKLIRFDQPLLRIPQLAIHLNRDVNKKGLILNEQNHLPPIFSLKKKSSPDEILKKMVAKELKCKPADITGLELSLYDTQPGTLAGPEGEFIFSGRLDNLASCHSAMQALAESTKKDPATRVIAFYDHEEVGSETAQGAGSPFLKDVLERIVLKEDRETFFRAMANSFFISADMAHAVHPNYSEKHDAQHMPIINSGPVIKSNANQRYATEGLSSAWFEMLCKKAGVPVQKFVVRSDLGCGSTIGPITAANLGIRTVDVGNPMLSMHSIREMSGTKDHEYMIRVFKEFFRSATG
ncbi:MAG: M18 family aminopeptidase [Nitrospina sp.]|nr:M18 family aminopeptidase [Nitrospina sp.]MBT3511187.1 M18 family aminopeptidase [Nitrospina sp.]MBT3876082.1 M18 family aminopeptidase [Nitrospina sp.]MBT4048390.1 M18 family aminopeptidase [Nitrospina sp.]MBT4556518.1 M18 family aminopeptidase [Nitrospina sp.]